FPDMRDGRAIRRDLDELFVGGVKRAIGNVSQCNIGRIIDRQVEPGGDGHGPFGVSPEQRHGGRPAASSARDAAKSPREGKFGLYFRTFRTSKGRRLGTRNRREPSRKSSRSRRAESVFSSCKNHFATTLASTTARTIARLPHLADESRAVPPRGGL